MADNPGAGYEPGLNPRSLSITYKKFTGVIPNELVVLLWRYSVRKNIEIIDAPNWLYVILEKIWENDTGFVGRSDHKIAINENAANNLAPGNYSAAIKIRGIISSDYSSSLAGKALTYTLTVNLTVLEGSLLKLSKKAFTFNYTRGENSPAGQFLTINTDNNWSISSDQSWLSFSQNNGQGNTTITLNADPAGISTSVNQANFLVDDGRTQIQGIVYLNIVGNGDPDYLNVSKTLITFSENYQKAPAGVSRFQVDGSMNSSVSTNVNWLELSPLNITSGVNQITVETKNTEILEIGTYTGKIEIAGYQYGSVFIDVLLEIVEETIEGLENGKLYFSGDRNKIKLGNARSNSEVICDFTTVGTLETLLYSKRAPYFQNVASLLIGQETETLLRPQLLPQLITQSFEPVIPIRFDFSVYDKVMGNQIRNLRTSFSNIRFLNGKTPAAGKLTHLPESLTVTKDSVIIFSFLNEDQVASAILTGDIQTSIPISATGTVVSFLLDLKEYSLAPGQSINLECGPVSVHIAIKPTQLPTTQLVWLNEWDCPEIFNCDGILQITDEEESTITIRNREGKEYSTIVEIQEPQSFKISTGLIYSEKEVAHLATILRSKKMWLQHGDQRWEVLRDFRNLVTSETRRSIRNFDLKFDLATI
ncbi:BACON domain-containing protein [Zunongwangia profunda]|uniref:BACON domain-containing protein n=1 Tax=Zunongwangia profunda TaxID=398743 RepID=UPI001D194751|nr:BACON domain-containing protein [Zunongwangia profunda]MCC4228365.1 BACON domain-containing protein [Zunongwangia profunda]